MPHFIIDLSEHLIYEKPVDTLMTVVHDTADATGLFKPNDIKVRIIPYKLYTTGDKREAFIHVFAYIMQGRTIEQKADLSKRIIKELKKMFPDVPVISMNVMDFEKATYCNREMVE